MKNILFVDDEPNFLKGLHRLLRRHKDEWQTSFAEGVDKALELISETSFDVIISDVHMPIKTGFDLLAELQANPSTRTIPIIILTGSSDNTIKRKALQSGATDLLNKPVGYEDLVARITSALRLKSYQDEVIHHNERLQEKVNERTAELQFLHHDLIWRLAKAGEMRDEETGDHVVRVAHYSKLIATALGLSKKEIELIFFTSPLHDLGKIATPDGILLKNGKLDELEWTIMMRHCQVGASILLEEPKQLTLPSSDKPHIPFSFAINDEIKKTAATIALNHHERWDGSGYPNNLYKTDIPLPGRIVAFADVYDALRSERPYKRPFSKEETWEIITASVGSHFDPDIFDKIKDMQEAFELIRDKHYE